MTVDTLSARVSSSDKEAAKSSSVLAKDANPGKGSIKAMTKVVIRHLPPNLSEESLLDVVGPLGSHNYFHFVPADLSLEPFAFSRAYINFLSEEDVYNFKNQFDGYVFVDNKGNEYQALVEFSPYQKIPKSKSKIKKDPRQGTIFQDPDYLKFLESLDHPDHSSLQTPEQFLEELEIRERTAKREKEKLTPLLEYVRDRKAEKARIRDERKELRRKKDEQRKKLKEEERKKKKDNMEKEIKTHGTRHKSAKARIADIKIKDNTAEPKRTIKTREESVTKASPSAVPSESAPLESEPAEPATDQPPHNESRKDKKLKNKQERPAIEIYRPGLGKFSSQRSRKSSTGEEGSSDMRKDSVAKKKGKEPARSVSHGKSAGHHKPTSSAFKPPPKKPFDASGKAATSKMDSCTPQPQHWDQVKMDGSVIREANQSGENSDTRRTVGKSYLSKRRERQQEREERLQASDLQP